VPEEPAAPLEPEEPEEPPPPTVALINPVCADEKNTLILLVSTASIFVGITTKPLLSNTVIAGYLSPKL
jgi:hypothetical protein